MQISAFLLRYEGTKRFTMHSFSPFLHQSRECIAVAQLHTLTHIALGALERSKFMPRSDAQFSLRRFFSFWQRARFAHRAHQCGILLFAMACVPTSGLGVWPFSSPSRSPPLNCIRTVLWDWSVTCARLHNIASSFWNGPCVEKNQPLFTSWFTKRLKKVKRIFGNS